MMRAFKLSPCCSLLLLYAASLSYSMMPEARLTESACFNSQLQACKNPAVSSLIQSASGKNRKHSPFRVALHPGPNIELSHYIVEIAANDPTAKIAAFVIQMCSNDQQSRSTFVHQASVNIATCDHPDDTMFQRLTTPQSTVSLEVVSTNPTFVSFRYLIVDGELRIHEGSHKATFSLFETKKTTPEKAHLRKRRVATDGPTAHLLIANGNYLHMSSLDGTQIQTLVLVDNFDDRILDVDFHYSQGHIYWTDSIAAKIMRANFDGSMITPALEQGLTEPDGISVDWVTDKVYFTDASLQIVGVFDLESNWYKVLLSTSESSQPRAIVVDPGTRCMYWTDWGSPAMIERASMDGSSRTVLHDTGLVWPNGLTIDYERQVLYWVDANTDVLESSNVDGTNRVTIADSSILTHAFGISTVNNMLFFSDWNGNIVRSMSMTGGDVATVFDSACQIPYGVVAVSEQRQATLTNPCSSSSCSHLCLLSATDSREYTCDCPEGYSLAADQENCMAPSSPVDYSPPPQGSCAAFSSCCMEGACEGNPPTCYCDPNCRVFGDCCQDIPSDCIQQELTPYLVYTSEFFIHQISLPVSNTSTQVRTKPLFSGFTRASDIDFHYRNGHLYWSDREEGKIWRSNFDGTGRTLILDTGSYKPTEIAVDWVTDKLYWVNATTNFASINVLDLTSGRQTRLITLGPDEVVHDLVLDPVHNSTIGWTFSGDGNPYLITSPLASESLSESVSATSLSAHALFIDYNENQLYWSDTQLNRVESTNLLRIFEVISQEAVSTAYTETNLLSNRDPLSMVIDNGTLYYVGSFRGVAAARVDSPVRVLNNAGCTNGDGIQLISSARQPQVNNPCVDAGCSETKICLLGQFNGAVCIESDPPNRNGTCLAASIITCCESGPCMGFPATCSCSSTCQLLGNCCDDVPTCPTDSTGPLAFIITPTNQSVMEPNSAQFQCSVNRPSTINWSFTQLGTTQPVAIGSQEGNDYLVDTQGSTGSTLSVLSAQFPRHIGEYTCTVADESEVITASAYLDVLVAPNLIVTGPSNPLELLSIEIKCTITANPSANIIWLKSSSTEVSRILESSRISFQRDDNIAQSVSTLQITRVTESDSGVYVCQADNGLTETPVTAEWSMNVTVVNECDSQPCLNGGSCVDLEGAYSCLCVENFQGENCGNPVPPSTMAPVITLHPMNATLSLASSLNLTCEATGTPLPYYSWYKDGELIEGEIKSYLYISEAQPDNRGEYMCKAVNSEGEANSSLASVRVPGVLQYSTQLQLSSSTSLDNLREVTLSLVNSELSGTNTSVFSVDISNTSQAQNAFEVNLLITLLNPDDQLSSDLLVMVRSALVSELLLAPMVISSAVSVMRFDGCEPEGYMEYSWGETSLGYHGTAPCPCAELLGEDAGQVRRLCGGTFTQGAQWTPELDFNGCETTISEVSQQLCDLALGEFSTNESVQVSSQVVDLTSQPQNLTTSHLTVASVVIEQLQDQATTNPEVRDNYLQTIDNVQQVDAETIFESQINNDTTTRILNSLGTFLDNVDLDSATLNTTDNITTLSFSTYAVRIQEVDPDTFTGQTFIVDLGTVEQAMNTTGEIDQDALITANSVPDSKKRRNADLITRRDIEESTASILLDPNFFDDCINSSVINQRLSYSVFRSDVLFLPANRTQQKVGSIVVSARVRCQLPNRTMLTMPVRTIFQTSVPENSTIENASCAVYEDRFGAWDSSLCSEIRSSDGTIRCECTQLGHFGILFDLNPGSLGDTLDAILQVASFVGLGISLVCLVVFIFTNLFSKKLRTNTHNQVLLNMAIALMGLYIIFLIGAFTTRPPELCGVVSGLLQYFFLVFFAWTTVEAIWLYLKLVTVLGSQSFTSKYLLKAGLPAWLIPAVIVIISGAASTGTNYYTSNYFCRPTEWPFYFGYILPFLVVYVFNWIVFILIMISVCKHTRKMSVLKEKTTAENARDLKKNFIIAISLTVVLGLGWGLGLAATSSDIAGLTFALQIVFCIFVGLQGVMILCLQGLRNPDFREFWTKLIIRPKQCPSYTISSERGQTTMRRSVGTTRTGSTAMNTLSRSSIPEKINFSKTSTADTFMSGTESMVQSPTDSVFASDSEMYSNPMSEVEPTNMQQNKSYQTWQGNNSRGGTSTDPPALYKEIRPISSPGYSQYENVRQNTSEYEQT